MNARTALRVVFLLGLWSFPARAQDLYVIDGFAIGPLLPSSCSRLVWDIDTVFYNFGSTDTLVTLLGVSNGGIPPGVPTSIALPAGRGTSIRQRVGGWKPSNAGALWVYHLSVPPEVQADSEMFPSLENSLCPGLPVVLQPFGKVRLPVFRSLVPAGQQQVHTGLTLGDVRTRINIAIYNAANELAAGSVEIRRACDGALVDARSVTVDPETLVQFGGFLGTDTRVDCMGTYPNGLNRLMFAVVTMDRPSLSFSSMLSNDQVPVSTIQVSFPER